MIVATTGRQTLKLAQATPIVCQLQDLLSGIFSAATGCQRLLHRDSSQ